MGTVTSYVIITMQHDTQHHSSQWYSPKIKSRNVVHNPVHNVVCFLTENCTGLNCTVTTSLVLLNTTGTDRPRQKGRLKIIEYAKIVLPWDKANQNAAVLVSPTMATCRFRLCCTEQGIEVYRNLQLVSYQTNIAFWWW